MTVGSAETDFLTVQVYNGIFNADLTETDALTDGFTVSGRVSVYRYGCSAFQSVRSEAENAMLSPLEIPSATTQPQAEVSL